MIPAVLAAMGAPIVMPPRVTVSEPAGNVGPLPVPPTVRTMELEVTNGATMLAIAGTMEIGAPGKRKPLG